MLSVTFDDGANDIDFSIDLSRSRATFCTTEILYIFRRNCYTSQGGPDSSFPYLSDVRKRHSDFRKRLSDVRKRHSDVRKRHSDIRKMHSDVRKSHSDRLGLVGKV